MLCIFCTNSINIYAGINGLEVGQVSVEDVCDAKSVVIACSLLCITAIDSIIGSPYGESRSLS